MQVPSLRFFVFFVARSRAALWTRFFNDFGHHFGVAKLVIFGFIFGPPKKGGAPHQG